MDKVQGNKIDYGIVLDNAQLREDAEQSKSILRNIGDAAEASAGRMDAALSEAAQNIRRQAGSLQTAFRRAFDEAGTTKLSDLNASVDARIVYLKQLESKYREVSAEILTLPVSPEKRALEAESERRKQQIDAERAALDQLKAKYAQLSAAGLSVEPDAGKQPGKAAAVHREQPAARTGAGASQWTGILQGLQGLTGAYSAGSTVIGLFTKDQERLLAVQTRMQSVMAVLTGMQQAANALHEASAFRLQTLAAVSEIYHGVTAKTAAALQGLGLSAKAAGIATKALYGTLSLGLTVAIGAAVAWYDKYRDAQQKTIEKAKEQIEVERAGRAQMIQTRFELDTVLSDLKQFNGTKEQEKAKVEELNRRYGESFGYYDSTARWYDVLRKKGEAYIEMLFLQAKVQSLVGKAQEADEEVNEAEAADPGQVEGAHGGFTRFFARLGAAQAGISFDAVDAAIDADNERIKQHLVQAARERRDAYLTEARRITEEMGAIGSEAGIGGFVEPGRTELPPSDTTQQQTDEYERSILAARERLAAAETELERNRIADKAELIEFDRQQTVAAIEKTREEALRAWTDMGRDAREFDGSVFERLIDAVDLQAAADTESDRSARAKKEKEEFDALLKQFRTYEQQRAAIVEEYGQKIAKLRAAGEEDASREAEKQRDDALTRLSQSMMEESDLWKRLLEDASKKSVSQIGNMIGEAQGLLDYLQGAEGAAVPQGFTEEDLQSLKGSPEAIEKVEGAIKRLKGEAGAKNPFRKFADEIESAFDKIEAGGRQNIGAGIMQIGAAVESVSPNIKKFGEDLESLFGENALTDAVQDLATGVQGVGQAAMGLGQIVSGNVLGGIMSLVSGAGLLASLFNNDETYQKQIEHLQGRIDQLQWELDNGDVLRLQASTENALDRVKRVYAQTTAEVLHLNAATNRYSGLMFQLSGRFHTEVMQKSVEKLAVAYANVEYAANKALGSARYDEAKDQLRNIAEQQLLIKQQIDNENAKKETDHDQVADWERQIQQLGNEAVNIVNDLVESIAGGSAADLAQQLGDAFIDAFRAGEDAAEAWRNKVNDIVSDIVKRMLVQEFLEKPLGKIFEDYKNKWFADGTFQGFDAVNDSMTGFAAELYALIAQFQGGMDGLPEELRNLLLANADAGRTASERGIATASQESVDELSGRATAIQGHTYSIMESARLLVSNSSLILLHVAGIETNTRQLARLEHIESDMKAVKSTVSDIALKGIKLKS